MEILASNLNIQSKLFLHAGYVSNSPSLSSNQGESESPYWSNIPRILEVRDVFDQNTPKVELEVTSSLRLKEDRIDEAAIVTVGVEKPQTFAFNRGNTTSMITGLGLFILTVVILYVFIKRLQLIHKKLVPALSVIALVVIVFIVGYVPSRTDNLYALPAPPPWEGVPIQEYADPEQATIAIVYALVAEGLRSIPHSVFTLEEIQDEVRLPKKDLTPGERYAIKTYGLDGWGTLFELQGDAEKGYRLKSAGPDKTFRTEDDLWFFFYSHRYEDFNYMERAFFFQEINGMLVMFFHRFNDGYMFEYNNQEQAIEITGSDFFDLVLVEEFDDVELKNECIESYNRYKDLFSYDPLVLQVRGSSERL